MSSKQQLARAVLDVIRQFERLPRSADLRAPQIQREIAHRVAERIAPVQADLPGVAAVGEAFSGIVSQPLAV